LVRGLEERYAVEIVKQPEVCMTMVRAEDSLDRQEFCLGEALTTECEVAIHGHPGIGLCLGDEPVRAYCQAVIDALIDAHLASDTIDPFLNEQGAALEECYRRDLARTLQTQVDFKLLEEE
jgi:alpha-D-ribose 1-methylphosphonate 5-triphosphate synthase subunit PhnG